MVLGVNLDHKAEIKASNGIKAPRLKVRPRGWDLGLEARMWALELGFGPWGCDLGLEACIRAVSLVFGP